MTGPSSPTSRQPLAFYDPASCALKMCQGILLWGGLESLRRLPAWGMTTSDGVLSGRVTPALLISVRAGSVLPSLPTPVVNDMGRGKTPEEWDSWTDEMKERHGNGNGHGPSLAIEAARLLPTPTPTTVDSKVFGPNVDWQLRLSNHAPHTASVLMNLPSNDGNGSSDDQPPPQLTTED